MVRILSMTLVIILLPGRYVSYGLDGHATTDGGVRKVLAVRLHRFLNEVVAKGFVG